MGRFDRKWPEDLKQAIIAACLDRPAGERLTVKRAMQQAHNGTLEGIEGAHAIPYATAREYVRNERGRRRIPDITALAAGELSFGLEAIAKRLLSYADREMARIESLAAAGERLTAHDREQLATVRATVKDCLPIVRELNRPAHRAKHPGEQELAKDPPPSGLIDSLRQNDPPIPVDTGDVAAEGSDTPDPDDHSHTQHAIEKAGGASVSAGVAGVQARDALGRELAGAA